MLRLALRDFAAEMGFDPVGRIHPRQRPAVCVDQLVLCAVMFATGWSAGTGPSPFIPLMSRLKVELL